MVQFGLTQLALYNLESNFVLLKATWEQALLQQVALLLFAETFLLGQAPTLR
jgi:hypothetical protein